MKVTRFQICPVRREEGSQFKTFRWFFNVFAIVVIFFIDIFVIVQASSTDKLFDVK